MRGNWLGFPSFQRATFWLVPLVTPSCAYGSIPSMGHRVRFSGRVLCGSPGLEDAIAVAQHGALVLQEGENEKGPRRLKSSLRRAAGKTRSMAKQPCNLVTCSPQCPDLSRTESLGGFGRGQVRTLRATLARATSSRLVQIWPEPEIEQRG